MMPLCAGMTFDRICRPFCISEYYKYYINQSNWKCNIKNIADIFIKDESYYVNDRIFELVVVDHSIFFIRNQKLLFASFTLFYYELKNGIKALSLKSINILKLGKVTRKNTIQGQTTKTAFHSSNRADCFSCNIVINNHNGK